jgi:hypothetical protein
MFCNVLRVMTFVVTVMMLTSHLAQARDEITSIEHGDSSGWFVNENDSLFVFYFPQTSPTTVCWSQNWFMWWQENPHVTITIWCAIDIDGSWHRLRTFNVEPWRRSYDLLLGAGVYCFEINCYRSSSVVTLCVE